MSWNNQRVLEDKIAILVVSCDKFSDLWDPYFSLFFRFWPECPFNIYLLSNRRNYIHPKVRCILTGEDVSWSDNLIFALKQIEKEYVFMMLDDFMLVNEINNRNVIEIFNWAIKCNANYVKMDAALTADKKFNNFVGVISNGTIYRTSTIMPLWKTSTLLNILRRGESAWDFEVFGTIRSDNYDGFYVTNENHFQTANLVVKGKWEHRALRKVKSLGVSIDLSSRKKFSKIGMATLYLKEFRSYLLKLMPSKYRRKIKHFLLGGKYNY